MKRSILTPNLIQALLPITVLFLVLFGWYMVYIQTEIIEQTTITAYQQTELELVRSLARSIDTYVSEQIESYQREDISAIEQEVLSQFIAPVRLLENGDAWIHTPDYVVFDLSADFPDEYRNKNIGEIFQLQRQYGASNYEQLVEGILQAKEGVGWYIWLGEKGREIAAWTPVQVNEYVWIVGISTPLSEIMETTGAFTQIRLLVIAMSVVTLIVFGLLFIWGISVWNHKKVRRALSASERKRRLHIEQTPMAMIECDHEGQILTWNQAAEKIFGYQEKEVMGKVAFHLLMPIEDRETVRQIWEQVYTNDIYAMRSTNKSRTKAGKIITCDWYNTHVLDESGKTIGVTLMAADVTERIERERQIREAKEEAENATRAKSEFLSNMSHELRTPLNGILGYAQILKRKLGLESDVINGLEIIHQSGDHLLTLINDILDLSKIEARKMELHLTPLELHPFLRGVVSIMRMRAEAKDILLKVEYDKNLPHAVQADETRLRQVLINLLSNAIKFTDHGQVLLRVKQFGTTRKEKTSFAQLRFEVSDTGVGISEKELKKIFLPFEQVGDSKSRAEGTGLGLSITRQLVQLMNGKIQVKSKVGQGTTFWVDLMLAITTIDNKKESDLLEIVSYEGQAKTILIVDDQLINRLVLRDILTPLGFEVDEAENGIQAIQKTAQVRPDLILMDLMMPEMDGAEAIRMIRRQPAYEQIKIIAVSANLFAQQEKSLIGYNDFITKPVRREVLLDKLQAHLQLSWYYKEKQNPDSGSQQTLAQMMIPPSQEMLQQLHYAAQVWDLTEIKQWTKQAKQDKHLAPFAQKVDQLADEFEGEQIQTLIESYLLPNKNAFYGFLRKLKSDTQPAGKNGYHHAK